MATLDATPYLKRVARAQKLGEQLGSSIQTWMGSKPAEATIQIADNRLSFIMTLKVNHQPPVDDERNHLFGEAVHHLRASLDNMAVGIAREAGAGERHRKQVAFPISASRDDWKADKSRIKHLPPEFQASTGR